MYIINKYNHFLYIIFHNLSIELVFIYVIKVIMVLHSDTMMQYIFINFKLYVTYTNKKIYNYYCYNII
jgi:hypothetical protein